MTVEVCLTTEKSAPSIRPLCLATSTDAHNELERIGVDQAGIVRMLPKLEPTPFLISGVRAAAANIIKQEMLSLGGDAAVARGTVACRIEQTDVLLIGTRKQLLTLTAKLSVQPFGLRDIGIRLANLLETSGTLPLYWQLSRSRLSLERPLIMGILNITPDSFSDGGRYLSLETAVERALQMEAEGADLIDIGGESSRPGAPPVSGDEETRRIIPVIEQLRDRLKTPVSVDTWKAGVADKALAAGAEVINDISGLTFDPALAAVAARHGAGLVLMHTRGTPQNMQHDTGYSDLMGEIADSLQRSVDTAISAGVQRERIVLDPGIGFGKDTCGNLTILRRLRELSGPGYPLLIGSSRKSFIGKTLGRDNTDDRLFGTAATVALAISGGASIIRVHDVRAMRDVADMAKAVLTT